MVVVENWVTPLLESARTMLDMCRVGVMYCQQSCLEMGAESRDHPLAPRFLALSRVALSLRLVMHKARGWVTRRRGSVLLKPVSTCCASRVYLGHIVLRVCGVDGLVFGTRFVAEGLKQ